MAKLVNAAVCKTAMRRFDPGLRLNHTINFNPELGNKPPRREKISERDALAEVHHNLKFMMPPPGAQLAFSEGSVEMFTLLVDKADPNVLMILDSENNLVYYITPDGAAHVARNDSLTDTTPASAEKVLEIYRRMLGMKRGIV